MRNFEITFEDGTKETIKATCMTAINGGVVFSDSETNQRNGIFIAAFCSLLKKQIAKVTSEPCEG
jgi:hypothetical protein